MQSSKLEFLQKAILQALIYADIFDYPLKAPEVWRFLIAPKKVLRQSVQVALARISTELKQIGTEKGFYFLKGREEVVALRKNREKWSQEKLEIAFRIEKWFKFIPWVKMVGITGALAMENSDENDDIDLIIVTTKNRLWLTRFFLVLLTELTGIRRKPQDKSFKNKACLNMFLTEDHLAVPEEERSLFTAHEVCQVKLIWDRNETYQKFLEENRWAKDYLPNGIDVKSEKLKVKSEKLNLLFLVCSFAFYILNFDFVESFVRNFQLWYMRKKRTIEKIEEGRVLFHPRDCSGWVMREYYDRVKEQERLEQE